MNQEEKKPKRRKRVAVALLIVAVVLAGLAALALLGPVQGTRRFVICRLLERQRRTPEFELGWSGELLARYVTDTELEAICRGEWGEETRSMVQLFLVDWARSLPAGSAEREELLGHLRDMALDLEARDRFRLNCLTAYVMAVPSGAEWPLAFEMMADENDSISATASFRLQKAVLFYRQDLGSMFAHVCAARMAAGSRFHPRRSFSSEQIGHTDEADGDEVFGDWLRLLVQSFAAEYPRESPEGATGLPDEIAGDFELAGAFRRVDQAWRREEIEIETEEDRQMFEETQAISRAAVRRLQHAAIEAPQSVWLEWARTCFDCSDEELALLGEFIGVAREDGREFREGVLLLGLLNANPGDEEARERLGSLRPDLLRLAPHRAPDGDKGAEAAAVTKEERQ